jgi:hypothetical protein
MNIKILILTLPLMLTACAATNNPNKSNLSDAEFIRMQQEYIVKTEREMEKREQELKYQHLKDLQMISMQQKAKNSECKLLCF